MKDSSLLTGLTGGPNSVEALAQADEAFDPFEGGGTFGNVLKRVASADLPGVIVDLSKLTADSPIYGPYVRNPRAIAKSGLGLFADKASGIGAIFNPEIVSKDEVAKVAKAGALPRIFPPAEQVMEAPQGGAPAEGATGVPSAPKNSLVTPPSAGAPPSSPGTPAPASVVSAGARARERNAMAPGPVAGGGSLLNSLLKKPK